MIQDLAASQTSGPNFEHPSLVSLLLPLSPFSPFPTQHLGILFKIQSQILSSLLTIWQWLYLTQNKSPSPYKWSMMPNLYHPSLLPDLKCCDSDFSIPLDVLASSLGFLWQLWMLFPFRYPQGSFIAFFQVFAQILVGFPWPSCYKL